MGRNINYENGKYIKRSESDERVGNKGLRSEDL